MRCLVVSPRREAHPQMSDFHDELCALRWDVVGQRPLDRGGTAVWRVPPQRPGEKGGLAGALGARKKPGRAGKRLLRDARGIEKSQTNRRDGPAGGEGAALRGRLKGRKKAGAKPTLLRRGPSILV